MRNTLILLACLPAIALAIPEGPEPDTPEWHQRENDNYLKTLEAPLEQLRPSFVEQHQTRSLNNELDWLNRSIADPSWLDPRSGNSNLTPLCTSWAQQCAGDPFRYPGTDPFYDNEAIVEPVVFYDAECARLSGRVWAPIDAGTGLPAVIIETGSVQAPEPLYWFMAQSLVRAGYVVMTFDVRGQGRSDFQAPNGSQGGNSNSTVFWEGLVNVIDFFRSDASRPYPHNETCAGTYPTEVSPFNPLIAHVDPDRLGLAGHSLGASGVSNVQEYGAEGADPWPGLLDAENPVDVIVAWDSLSSGVVPRVPAMGHSSEYGLTPARKMSPPDPEGHKSAYANWQSAGLPVFQITPQGSTHYEWSLIPTFPTTSWCPDDDGVRCAPGYGQPLGEYYSLAWFDRWLKLPGEMGYEDADARLLDDAAWVDRYSFYYRSARDYPDRNGVRQHCEDIRAGCDATAEDIGDAPAQPPENPQTAAGGGSGSLNLASWLLLLLLGRRRLYSPGRDALTQ